jgi:hypothetical protein
MDLQVGVKAPGTPKRMTFLPAARELMETCCSWSLSSNQASWPSGRVLPTPIGAMGALACSGGWDLGRRRGLGGSQQRMEDWRGGEGE